MTEPARADRPSFASRLPAALLYGVLGLIVGLIGSFTHRARLEVAGVTVWYGIVVALVCVLAFTVGLRAYTRDRVVEVSFAVGVVVGIVFIGLGLGHSVIVLGDPVGLTWLVAAPLLAFAVAFWPRFERPTARSPHTVPEYPESQPRSATLPPQEPQP